MTTTLPSSRSLRFVLASVVLAVACLPLIGCSAYQLRGKVIQGDISYIAIVNADDERLDGPGVGGVEMRLTTDPEKLNRKTVGTAVSAPDGSFTIPVDEVGAGVLIYDVGLSVRGKGFIGAEQFFRLPPSGKRVLITLERGADNRDFSEDEDLYEEYRRLSR